MPWLRSTRPAATIVTATEVVTEQLCMIAVRTVPTATRSSGFRTPARNSFTASIRAKSPIEPLISPSPTKSMPKPARIPPIFFQRSFLQKRLRTAPTPANPEKTTVMERAPLPERPRETICAVTVVPMFAPKMIVVAWRSDITPALTKPSTMTMLALELWTTAVTAVPMPTPSSLLLETLEKRNFSLADEADSRFELIIWQAIRKMPTPATSERTDELIVPAVIAPNGRKSGRPPGRGDGVFRAGNRPSRGR